MAGLKYWVWLSEVKGLTNRSKLLLLDYFGTPENVYYADEDVFTFILKISLNYVLAHQALPPHCRRYG